MENTNTQDAAADPVDKSITRVALVTGGNRGLGFEICCQLGKLGFTVVLACRNADAGSLAVEKLKAKDIDVVFHEVDVGSLDSISSLHRFVVRSFGRLDVLVNNAGVLLDHRSYGGSSTSSIFDTSMEDLADTMKTNVYGPFMMCQAFIPLMQKNDYGRIVNISSKAGQLSQVSSGVPCYRLSKVALNGVTRIFSDESGCPNILINSVCPGWVKTEMGGPNAHLDPKDAIGTIIWLAALPDDGPTGAFFSEKTKIDW